MEDKCPPQQHRCIGRGWFARWIVQLWQHIFEFTFWVISSHYRTAILSSLLWTWSSFTLHVMFACWENRPLTMVHHSCQLSAVKNTFLSYLSNLLLSKYRYLDLRICFWYSQCVFYPQFSLLCFAFYFALVWSISHIRMDSLSGHFMSRNLCTHLMRKMFWLNSKQFAMSPSCTTTLAWHGS